MDINKIISEELKLNLTNVNSAVELLDNGDSVPFISRYRKEVTGGLNDEEMRNIESRLLTLRNLADRKNTVYKSLADQNITIEDNPELFKKIDETLSLTELEDIYRPYKPKKLTRATKAIKAGLKPLSEYIKTDKTGNLNEEAKKYLTEENAKEFPTVESVIQGAWDIIAEEISDNPSYRVFIKDLAFKSGVLQSTKLEKVEDQTYDNYQNYSRLLTQVKPYNTLAINRGVNRKCLSKKIILDDEYILKHISTFEIPRNTPYTTGFQNVIEDSYDRLIYPSVCNDIFSTLMDTASDSSIEEFKASLKATLLFPPLKGRKVLGFDPGFSHGCKLAIVDENGKLLEHLVLKDPYHSEYLYKVAKDTVIKILNKYKIFTIALGNGTASRESQKMLEEIRDENSNLNNLEISVVSESGASIYSATASAQKEFPELEPNIRSSISIARRLQDPLAELVKIPPESIGVGQYQYDIDNKKLKEALKNVVEDCVNYVGVDLNSASYSLLSYVSGISEKVAISIVSYRDQNGTIKSREELKSIKGLGPKVFENCAGFLRIPESKEMLDNTSVHPESYSIAYKLLDVLNLKNEINRKDELSKLKDSEIKELSNKLNCGFDTLKDIIKELIKPSRDPRSDAKTAKLNPEVTDIKQISVGQILEGTIRNVTGFGFFVDIGVEIDGLVHISQIASHFVSDPHSEGKPGDIVKVKVIEVDVNRKRISLTMKDVK